MVRNPDHIRAVEYVASNADWLRTTKPVQRSERGRFSFFNII